MINSKVFLDDGIWLTNASIVFHVLALGPRQSPKSLNGTSRATACCEFSLPKVNIDCFLKKNTAYHYNLQSSLTIQFRYNESPLCFFT